MATLKDHIAMVTGATGGIGGAIAMALAKLGVVLCISGRDETKLDATAQRLRAVSTRVIEYPCDLTSDNRIEDVCEKLFMEHQRLDILVHCAGSIAWGKLGEVPLASFDEQLAANVRGPFLLSQKLIPLLKKPRGQIVFINSSAGLTTAANRGYYSATQHALKALADTLREEENANSIRVLSVFPGRTATPRIEALYERESQPYRPDLLLQPEDVANVVVNAILLPWTAEVTNISIRPMRKSY
jgi:NADP-dependent 3-hydroxy acid dehydrogenase YdfG